MLPGVELAAQAGSASPSTIEANGPAELGDSTVRLPVGASWGAMTELWMADAACRGLTGLMFPERGDLLGVGYARAVCNACPVWWPCLSWAMTAAAPSDGVLAGLSPRERLELRRVTPRPPSVAVALPRPASTGPMPWTAGRFDAPMTTWTKGELLDARDTG